MAAQQKPLPDEILTEVWTLMHLAVASDLPHNQSNKMKGASKEIQSVGGHILSDFTAEGDMEMEGDGPFDGNANESTVDDMQALKESADILVAIGDTYIKEKGEEKRFIDDIVECLHHRAINIDEKLERELCSAVPPPELFQENLVSIAYSEVKTRLETFLVGSGGFDKIAMVTHITKGVSEALRNISLPAASLATALSYRFVTEKYGDLILENGGLGQYVQQTAGVYQHLQGNMGAQQII